MEIVHVYLFMMLYFEVDGSSSDILQRQRRNWIIDSYTISESYIGPFPYTLGIVKVEKTLSLFQIEGQGVDEEPKGILKIDQYTGEITVHGPVDCEKFNVLRLKFMALDKFSHMLDTRLGIEIRVIDSNDNAPKFDHERYEISIQESTLQGTEVITLKATDGDSDEINQKFDLRIASVTPQPQDLEFYLTLLSGGQVGTISFKGCLDHEKAEKYTIVVEAKDRGEPIQLSSSCTVILNIEDGNNHLPVITQQIGPGKVKEGEENVVVSRLQVTDHDIKGTAAWRAKFQIHGDTNNNFNITTDPDTNEGLLYVQKHLNYEDGPQKNVTVSVENEIPYFSCEVKKRTTTGLWTVIISHTTRTGETISSAIGTETVKSLSTYHVTVIVEDVNEPPIFKEPNKTVKLVENIEAGHYLVTLQARDPDVTSRNTIVYIKGNDPAGWVTVDSSTGKIITSKIIDRESHYVKDNIYVVTICAVDNGKPQMTGTATLNIYITDENDNAPSLAVSTIDMCQSQGPSLANITAVDLDAEPYGGPFNFKLHGDVEGKWKVDPVQGYSVTLVKENRVYSGQYELLVEVSDLQSLTAVHNLTVTVCDCLDTAKPNCRIRKLPVSAAGGGVIGIILFGILLFAGLLLLGALVSCKTEKESLAIPIDDSQQYLMNSNIEKPGSDCKVSFDSFDPEYGHKGQNIKTVSQASMRPAATISIAHNSAGYGMSQTGDLQEMNYLHLNTETEAHSEWSQSQRMSLREQMITRRKSTRSSMGASSMTQSRHEHRNFIHENGMGQSKYFDHKNSKILHDLLLHVINKRLQTIQAVGQELGDYHPHVYAEEGDPENNFKLDAISIHDISFDPQFGQDLDLKFKELASICMPSESTASSKNNPPGTLTLVQVESHKTNEIMT